MTTSTVSTDPSTSPDSGGYYGLTRIRAPFWAWLALESFFGLAGFYAVFLAPQDTATNFAWTIRPPVMAAVFGAFYLATAVMLVGVLAARRWEEVRAVVVAAGAVTTLMLVNTVLHWDVFAVGSPAFTLWLVSYVVPPPVLVALLWWHDRRAVPIGTRRTDPMPPWFRALCLVNGAAFVVVETVLYVVPALLVDRGPWTLSPLTVRTLAGWLIGLGLLLVMIGWDGDWRRARFAALLPLALGPALAFQLVRFSEQVDWGNIWLLLDLVDLLLLSAAMAWMWLRSLSVRRLAQLALAGAAVFLGTLLAVPLLRPDLDVLSRWVAEYARGPLDWVMVLAYVALAVAVWALARGLAAAGGFGRLGPMLLAVAGIGAMVAAILPQDPSDVGAATSMVGTVRQLALVPVFLSLFAALLLLSRRFWTRPGFGSVHVVGTTLALASVAALVVVFLADPSWRGLVTRVYDVVWTGWLLVVALRLQAVAGGAAPEGRTAWVGAGPPPPPGAVPARP